jgi:outer membrane protein
MNGKPGRFTLTNVYATGLLLVMLVWIANAWAFDPLFTMPDVIKEGKPLPGDTEAVKCPPPKDFSMPLFLGEAVDLGLCNNPRIKATWAQIKIQAGVVGEARAAYLPTLNGWAGYLYDTIRYPGSAASDSTVNNYFFGGGLTWRILDFGGRGANRQAANNLLAAALLNHDDTIQKNLSDIIQAYFDAMTTKASWKAKAQNEGIARDTLDVAQRREANGTTARSDTLQAATALAKASLEKNRAEGAFHKAISVLIYSMGIPSQTSVLLPDDLGEMTGQEVADLDALMKDVQKNHPAIQASRAKLEAARHQVTVAQSEGLPSFDFSANYYQNARPGQSTVSQANEYALGVTLNIPLFDGFSRSYKIQEAKAQVEQKEAELQDVEYQTLMDLVKAHADATSALQNLQAADALLKAAIESLEVSKRRYEKGATDILEMLNTQSALADARMESIRSQAEWNAARLRLLASARTLNRAAVDRGSLTISASAPAGTATNSATETVTTTPPASAPTVQISADFPTVIRGMAGGQSSTLTWSSINATTCSIDQGIGTVNTSGSITVSPTTTTTYTITATGPGGTATNSVTITLTPPTPQTVILRPNANGDLTQLRQYPLSGDHYDKVDEKVPDEGSTYVGGYGAAATDLYGLTKPSSESGAIYYVRLYTRLLTGTLAQGAIETGGTIYYGTARTSSSWQTFSDQWDTNPQTGQPWTWSDIDLLQAGVFLTSGSCTQVYVEVNYTPSP